MPGPTYAMTPTERKLYDMITELAARVRTLEAQASKPWSPHPGPQGNEPNIPRDPSPGSGW